jgi:hypothetical protein
MPENSNNRDQRDFSGQDISGQNFDGRDFSPIKLVNREIGIVALSRYNFSKANAKNCSFSDVKNIEYAIFDGADLEGAQFLGTTNIRPEQLVNAKNIDLAKFNNPNMPELIKQARERMNSITTIGYVLVKTASLIGDHMSSSQDQQSIIHPHSEGGIPFGTIVQEIEKPGHHKHTNVSLHHQKAVLEHKQDELGHTAALLVKGISTVESAGGYAELINAQNNQSRDNSRGG